MAKYRPPKTPPGRTFRKHGRWLAAAATVAIIGALAAAIITPRRVNSSVSWVSDLFGGGKPTRSEAETVIGKVFENVRRGEFWEGRPTLYPSSRRYLIKHFKQYDPRQSHGSYLLPQEPVLSPSQLAVATPIYAGNRVTILGRVRTDTIGEFLPTESHIRMRKGGPKVAAPNATYIAQIAGPGNKRGDPLVDVEYAAPASPPFSPGQWIVAVGVPIARGGVKLNVGGFVYGVYMVAGSIEPVRAPRSVLRSVHRLELKLNRARKRCQPLPDTWWCRRIKSTTGHL
jgi:hypothetical protein